MAAILWQGPAQGPSEAHEHSTQQDRPHIMTRRSKPAFGGILYFSVIFVVGGYFTFAAVQGDYGLFSRAEVEAESAALQEQLDQITLQVARMENLTKRLSDTYLDLDLLDAQARSILGLMRTDEIIIR